MTLPTVTKTWTIAPNNRITFVSLNDTMARFLYGIKNFLVATRAWTVKYTCDGTTGPTSSSDHTDRWASQANVTTRGALSTNAQSFAVLTDGNGTDILLAYQGSSDDRCYIGFSNGGLYLPAGTANNAPTATDEAVVFSAATMVNATASADRVWHIMASTDNKIFRVYIYRSSTLLNGFGCEVITSSVVASSNFPVPVVAWATNVSANTLYSAGAIMGATTTNNWGLTRINGINATCGGGGEGLKGTGTFTPTVPQLQAASIITPIATFASASTAGTMGKVGTRFDIWPLFCTGINQADTLGSLAFIYFATHMLPWDGVTAPAIA